MGSGRGPRLRLCINLAVYWTPVSKDGYSDGVVQLGGCVHAVER